MPDAQCPVSEKPPSSPVQNYERRTALVPQPTTSPAADLYSLSAAEEKGRQLFETNKIFDIFRIQRDGAWHYFPVLTNEPVSPRAIPVTRYERRNNGQWETRDLHRTMHPARTTDGD
jgi:hypothetical protein